MAESDEYNVENLNYEAEATDEVGVEDEEIEDSDIMEIKERVRKMEEEAEKLRELQTEVEKQLAVPTSPPSAPMNLSFEEKMEVDGRSVYIGNVDYAATAEEVEQHFHGCGSINRVTILCNKFDGHPKGFAYVEFTEKESVQTAMALDDSLFKGRQIKVMPKRTNRPGISSTNRRPRGRGIRGGRGSRGGFGYMRRRAGFRGRASYYSPY